MSHLRHDRLLRGCRSSGSFGALAFRWGALKGWRVRLYLSHRLAVVYLLPAIWTLVVLQVRNRVCFPLEDASPIAANLSYFRSTTRRADFDVKLCLHHIALLDDTRK